jgi:Pectinesterase
MKSPATSRVALFVFLLCVFSAHTAVHAQTFAAGVDCPVWQNPNRVPPNITIGSFVNSTPATVYPISVINSVMAGIPANNQFPIVIAIAPGIYNGTMILKSSNVTLIGCGWERTIISDSWNTQISTATLTVTGSDVTLEHLQVANHRNDYLLKGPNPIGPANGNIQAVALTFTATAKRCAVRYSYLYGFQDTFYIKGGQVYVYNTTVLGKTDYIFGDGVLFMEESTLESIPGGGCITAPSTPASQTYGLVFVNCRTKDNFDYGLHANQTYRLGRGWNNWPMATFINTTIQNGQFFNMTAWTNMGVVANTANISTCMSRFAEYGTKWETNPLTNWTIEHPRACPNYSEPWVRPIIARETMTPEEVDFYSKTKVLGGWNPAKETNVAWPATPSSSAPAPPPSSSGPGSFSSSASRSSSMWWQTLSSSAASFASSVVQSVTSSSSSSRPVVTPTPIDDVLGTLIPLHGPASSYDAANVHVVTRDLLNLDLSPYLERLENDVNGKDDALFVWDLPFPFRIGNYTTSTAYVSTNGNIQFGAGMHSYRFVPEPLPKGDGELLPLLSYLFTDLESTVASEFYVADLGVSPNRAALLRVPSVVTPTSTLAGSTSIDVILFEGLDRIEIRYYRVHQFSEPVLIALQPAKQDDFVVLWNAKPFDSRASKAINGSTIVFQPRAAFV